MESRESRGQSREREERPRQRDIGGVVVRLRGEELYAYRPTDPIPCGAKTLDALDVRLMLEEAFVQGYVSGRRDQIANGVDQLIARFFPSAPSCEPSSARDGR